MDPKVKGERSEGMVLAALLRAGKVILQPFGDSQRYDLVIDDEGTFVRVQCKTGRLKEGAIIFATSSRKYMKGQRCAKDRRDYLGEADLFGIYVPELDKCYLIPVKDVPTTEASLRVEASKNGQTKGIRLAADYELGGV